MTIKMRLALVCVSMAVFPALIVAFTTGTQAFRSGQDAIVQLAEGQLTAIRENKKQQIEDYFNTILDQLRTSAVSTMTVDAMQRFAEAVENQFVPPLTQAQRSRIDAYYRDEFGREYAQANPGESSPANRYLGDLDSLALYFQYHFIAGNPHPLGEKDNLVDLGDGSDYAEAHRRYHPPFRTFLQAFDYYDIFLVEPEQGRIVYSVFKELDYMTPLRTGPYANTGIAQAFNAAMRQRGTAVLIDFAPYPPSYEDPASFAAITIEQDENVLGVLIFQMPVDRINHMMTHGGDWIGSGLGESGETYLVGDDRRLRSQSRFLIEDMTGYLAALRRAGVSESLLNTIGAKETAIGLQPSETEGVRRALAGQTGFDRFPDYRGVPVLSAYTPLNIPGVRWALMSEIDEAEAFAPSQTMARRIIVGTLVVALIIVAVAGGIGLWLAARMTRPIQQLSQALTEIEQHANLAVRLPAESKDEIGDSERALNQMLVSFQQIISSMNQVAEALTGSATEMASLTATTRDGAQEQEQESAQVSTAATEMSATIEEVARSAQSASNAAQDADAAAHKGVDVVKVDIEGTHSLAKSLEEATQVINILAEDSNRIGGVLEVIRNIAEQTNLLALNAAIEAARAGEQGRGFAVVADEVRTLAKRTQDSTHEIQQMIDQLQSNARQAVTAMESSSHQAERNVETAGEAGEALDKISQSVHIITQMNEQIATATEQQLVVAESISASIINISTVAAQNVETANDSAQTAARIEALASDLRDQAARFKV